MNLELKFSFTNEEDGLREAKNLLNANDWAYAFFDFDQDLRSKLKYSSQEYISLEEARALIREKLEEKGLSFEDVL